MLRCTLAIFLVVHSFLLTAVTARPWFVSTKTWGNSTTFQNSARSFNYTAILEAHKVREVDVSLLVKRNANATVVGLGLRSVNITLPHAVVPRVTNLTTNSDSSNSAQSEIHARNEARQSVNYNYLSRLTRIQRHVYTRKWDNSTILHRSVDSNSTRTLAPRSLTNRTSLMARIFSSSTVHGARSITGGTSLVAHTLNTTSSPEKRSLDSSFTPAHIRQNLKGGHWLNTTSSKFL